MVDSVTCLRHAECARAPDHVNAGFLGRWGTHACPQLLPSDIVPIRSWTWTLPPSGIRHRHLPCHAMPCRAIISPKMTEKTSMKMACFTIIAALGAPRAPIHAAKCAQGSTHVYVRMLWVPRYLPSSNLFRVRAVPPLWTCAGLAPKRCL
jgi:hypothetical protein